MLEVMSCKKLTKETKQDVVEIQGDLPEGVVKRLERGNKRIDIVYHQDAESPREWCNLSIMACSHRRYNIGEEQPNTNGPKNAVLVRTLWFHEHGMGKLYTGEWPPDESDRHDRFDTSCIGYIYTTKKKIKLIYGNETPSDEEIVKRFDSECEVYTQYHNGEVYGFNLYDLHKCSEGECHEEFVDACYGFYSIDDAVEDSGFLS